MKKVALLTMGCLLTLSSLQAKQKKGNENIVSERYVHKYGLEMDRHDWSHRGKDGKVDSKLDDGTRIIRSYVHGTLDGETTYSFPHSHTIAKREVYDNGNLVITTLNRTDGNPEREIQHLGPEHTIVTDYYDNNNVQSVEEIKESFLISGEYFETNGHMESNVKQGEGKKINRNNMGDLISHDIIERGELKTRLTFHPRGTPESITPYRGGLVEGERKVFTPTGEPLLVETWVENKRNGITLQYENGELIAEIPYKDNRREGVEKRFNDQGFLVQEVSWTKGHKHGPSFSYLDDVTQAEWFFKGKPTTKSTYDQMKKKKERK